MVQCYYKNDDQPNLIRSINSGVCEGSGSAAGFFSCCFPWDLCLPDGLCYGNSNSMYYTALCTDQTLSDGACQKGCDGRYRTGVRYNETDNLWACCDSSDTSCSTTKNATFQAEAPDELRLHTMTIVDFIPTATATSSAATSTSSLASSTSTMSAGPSSTASDQTQKKSGSSLSTGAIAGISVGIALAVVALLVCIGFWLMRKRKRNSTVRAELHSPEHDSVEKHGVGVVEVPTSYQLHYDQQKKGARTNATGLYELT